MAVLRRLPVSRSLLLPVLLGLPVLPPGLHAAMVPAVTTNATWTSHPPGDTPALSRQQLHALLRHSDLVAVVRVLAFTPETFDKQTHRGTAAQTKFAVKEMLHGSSKVSDFQITCICSPEQAAAHAPVGTEMIVFARYDAKDKIWEPADEVYAYMPSAKLRQMILASRR